MMHLLKKLRKPQIRCSCFSVSFLLGLFKTLLIKTVIFSIFSTGIITIIHPWTGYMIDVVAYQQTLKEAQHEMQVAREFTHERTKQRITHLNALAMAPAAKARSAMPRGLPRGRGMTRRADRYFVQQQLGDMNLEESAFAHRPHGTVPSAAALG